MKPNNFFNFLEKTALKYPDSDAVVDSHGSKSFRLLHQEASDLKDFLSSHGLGNQMIVSIILPNGGNFITALFATAGTGATVLPIYTGLTPVEREETYKVSNVKFVLGEARYLGHELVLGEELGRHGSFVLIAFPQISSQFLLEHIRNPAVIRFSSGTTGKSKGVILSHESVFDRTKAVFDILNLRAEQRVLWVLPMAFHFVATIIAFVRYGITTIVCPSFFAEELLSFSNQFKADLLYASPLHIRLLSNLESTERFESLEVVISTSSGISMEHCEAFKTKFNIPVSQAYGIIEVGLPLYNRASKFYNRVGSASGGYEVGILNDDFNLLEDEKVGKLGLRGPGMFDGYMLPPVVSKNVLKNGWFITGDLAIKYNDGSVEICGREKSMINVSGNKVFPEEVEHALESINGIKEAHVFSSAHPLTGEIVEADLVLEENSGLTESEILFTLQKLLTAYKIPKKINLVKALTFTATGKKIR